MNERLAEKIGILIYYGILLGIGLLVGRGITKLLEIHGIW